MAGKFIQTLIILHCVNIKLLTQVVHLLSPTGSTVIGTGLSSLTNGIWEIHAECYCMLPLSATFGQNWIDS